jgi:hypothetical protein
MPFHDLPPEVLAILTKYDAPPRLVAHLTVVHDVAIAQQIAQQCQEENWQAYMKLDDIACELA